MRIKELYLVGYKPLYLSNIKEITYTPEAILQIVLGTNGSGKTSLLRAASPMPAEKSEYDPGGVKRVDIEHKGNDYVLHSKLGKSNHHSFIKNGVEMNEGGTITIQKELVETEFNYTARTHSLLTGMLSFTDMSLPARKALLLSLSDIGIDFAMELFDKVKTVQRDAIGAIKHVAIKVDELTARQLSNDRINEIRLEAEAITTKITNLMPYTNMSITSEPSTNEMAAVMIDIEKQVVIAEKAHKSIYKNIRSLGGFDKAVTALSNQQHGIVEIDATIKSINEQLAFYEDAMKRMEETKNEDPTSVEANIKGLKEELESVDRPDVVLETNHYMAAVCMTVYRALEALSPSLSNVKLFSRDDIAESEARLKVAKDEYASADQLMKKLEAMRQASDHAAHHDHTCRECGHLERAQGSLPKPELEKLLARLEQGKAFIEKQTAKITALELAHADVEQYKTAFNQVKSVIDNSTVLMPKWSLVGGPDAVISNPLIALQAFADEHTAINHCIEYDNKVTELNRLETLLVVLRESENNGEVARVLELEARLDAEWQRRESISTSLAQLEKGIGAYKAFSGAHAELDKLHRKYADLYMEWANRTGQHEANKNMRALQTQLAGFQFSVTAYESVQHSLTEMQGDLELLKVKKQNATYLMKALSPKEGIIALAMRSIIQGFMDDVNMIVSNIWEYPMSVGISKSGWGNLDYKFSLNVMEKQVDEIGLGSEGQKDVINFGVTLCIMKRLGLMDYPLYLDEIGNTFDHKHRSNLLNYIKRLVEAGVCSQMFLINHYSTEHGGLSNADIIVLSPDNIIVPENYNNVIKII